MTQHDLKLVYDDDPESYTWRNYNYKSYLDFFVVKNVKYNNFRILD